MKPIVNSSAYYFMELGSEELPALQCMLKEHALQCKLKGTILLSPEGINLALAGSLSNMTSFKKHLSQCLPALSDLTYNESYSSYQPFQHLFVKLKKQIIPFPDAFPSQANAAPYITPQTLQNWLENSQDMLLLDTRNQYEVEAGTFHNTISLSLNHFRDFPKQAATILADFKQKPIVSFCTGGIRCEKASAELLTQGFTKVYQLKGGILNYFHQCGNAYYQGGCFVFDEREIIHPDDMQRAG
jgi:UPF0176 protein